MGSPSTDKFVTALIINAALAIIFYTFFAIFRKRVKPVYEPRAVLQLDRVVSPAPSPPGGVFGWILPTFRYSDERLFQTHGLDALMFVKFTWYAGLIALVQMVFSVVLLIPIYVTAENPNDVSGIDLLSMATVDKKSLRLIASLFAIIFNSLASYYFLYKLYSEYASYRLRVQNTRKMQSNFSVLVRDVPTSVTKEELLSELEALLPGQVENVVAGVYDKELEKKVQEREVTKLNLERAQAVLLKTSERPVHKVGGFCCCGGAEVDSIDTYTAALADLDQQIVLSQSKVSESSSAFIGSAIVSLTTTRMAKMAVRSLFMPNPAIWRPMNAPEPRDVMWPGLGTSHTSRVIRSIIVNTFITFLVFFWVIPVTFAASLANLSALASVPGLSFLSAINDIGAVVGIIQGFLPTLVLIIFWALLVTIIRAVSTAQGLPSKSIIDRSILSKYYFFIIFNGFFVFILSGSIFNSLDAMIDDPASIPTMLASSVPTQATFFINYVMIQSLAGHCMALWRPGPLIVRCIFHKYLSKSARDFRAAEFPGRFSYETAFVSHLMIFLLMSMYSTLSPFLMPFACIYFFFAYLSQKYNIVHVFVPDYEGSGNLWPTVFNRCIASLVVVHITYIGIFAAYIFPAAAIVAAVFIPVDLVLSCMIKARFHDVAKFGCLSESTEKEALLRSEYYENVETKYKVPLLCALEAPEVQSGSKGYVRIDKVSPLSSTGEVVIGIGSENTGSAAVKDMSVEFKSADAKAPSKGSFSTFSKPERRNTVEKSDGDLSLSF